MLFTIVKILLVTICCTAAGAGSMHILQAERYQIAALHGQMRRHGDVLMLPNLLIALGVALVNWYLPVLLSMAIRGQEFRDTLCGWIVLAVFCAIAVVIYLQKRSLPQKKPFVCTRRICRLIGMTVLLNLLGVLLLNLLSLPVYLMLAGADYAVLLSATILRPLEDWINAGFFNSARQKLAAQKGMIRIGVTGSYGKTETKMILRGILSEKYRVLATPPSFSTAMGISRTINEQLKSGHQVFIAEMGAQHKGEIREMVKLVHPQYGVLTCVGGAHMDTFGSNENISQSKFELVQGLPEKGIAFFGSDGSYGDRLYAMCKKEKYRAGIGTETVCYMHAENMETSGSGTSFELICEDGERRRMETKLLGAFSVQNIALAAAVAHRLGMRMDEIAAGVAKLAPLKHHLQLVEGDVRVIDDSLNQLPEGGAEALRVLRDFPGRRILVTTGFTELNENADDKNFAFGTQIPGCADYVILIGPENTRPIVRGLMTARYSKAAVRVVSEMGDAAALVREMAEPGDSVLYECVYPEEDAEEAQEG